MYTNIIENIIGIAESTKLFIPILESSEKKLGRLPNDTPIENIKIVIHINCIIEFMPEY
ncbi:MAG: hypothetical protein IAC55_03670, partial [Tyzzerella sp.]|nr:hypothetical protein [Candidatus Fimicola merdigallinarum]